MIHPISELQKAVTQVVSRLWPELVGVAVDINHSPKPEFGDYSSPVALAIGKQIGINPLEIAQQLADGLQLPAMVAEITVSPPGFVNFRLDHNALSAELLKPIEMTTAKPMRISIEHTSVNPNKAAHIGHLRNACLGDTLARLMRYLGHTVEVQNYIDDLGVQVADSVVAFETFGDAPEGTPVDVWFWQIYAKVNQLYTTKPELVERREAVLHEMEKGENQTAKQIVERIVASQLKTFERFGISYDLLVYEHDIVEGELWDKLFAELQAKNLIHQPTEGAHAGAWVVAFGDSEREDKILVRSNGLVTYTGKDLAYALWKFGLGPTLPGYESRLTPIDEHINVIDERQSYPQAVIRHVMAELGHEQIAQNYRHLGYGVVKLSSEALKHLGYQEPLETEDKKSHTMSGRAGVGVMADELLRTATQNQEEKYETDPETSRQIAIGSLRYYMLKSRPQREVVFDFDEALRADGNTGVYLQYAYARANNILNKLTDISAGAPAVEQVNSAEKNLLLQLAEFSHWLERAAVELDPSLMADYGFELANRFAKFYETSPVIKAETPTQQQFRANLIRQYLIRLEETMKILGIPVLAKI